MRRSRTDRTIPGLPRFSHPTHVAIRAAEAAGRIQLELYGRARTSWKGSGNPVTVADRRGERDVRAIVRRSFPDHAFLGEEDGASGSSPYRWLIDPVDGTINYTHGFPHFGVAIALEYTGGARVGVIFDPMLGELFAAEIGRGAWMRVGFSLRHQARRWRRLAASSISQLDGALLATCSHEMPAEIGNLDHATVFASRVQRVYTLGSAALELAWVAAGRLEGFWEAGLPPWDTIAGALLVREAGGRVTDFRGEEWCGGSKQIVASNGRIHSAVLACLRGRRHGW